MVLKHTPICDFGWRPHDFKLINVDEHYYCLDDLCGENGLVVVFACNHCPYVIAIQDNLIADAQALQKIGINTVLINANDDKQYPEDSFENMQIVAQQKKYPFPYLHDPTQEVAKSWKAVCTPDFFGFNKKLELQYRGRLDSSGKNATFDSRRDLLIAMQQVVETNEGPAEQIPSMGCSIKWRQ